MNELLQLLLEEMRRSGRDYVFARLSHETESAMHQHGWTTCSRQPSGWVVIVPDVDAYNARIALDAEWKPAT